MTELKSCPFCGGKAAIHCDIPRFYGYGYGVGCSNPDCIAYSGYGMAAYEAKEDAISAWNRRAEHTATRISVPREGHTAIGHYECGGCRGVVGAQDAHCKHCGCRLVEP